MQSTGAHAIGAPERSLKDVPLFGDNRRRLIVLGLGLGLWRQAGNPFRGGKSFAQPAHQWVGARRSTQDVVSRSNAQCTRLGSLHLWGHTMPQLGSPVGDPLTRNTAPSIFAVGVRLTKRSDLQRSGLLRARQARSTGSSKAFASHSSAAAIFNNACRVGWLCPRSIRPKYERSRSATCARCS